MTAKGEGLAYKWMLAHADYPHEDWCLIWPYFLDKNGRGWLTHERERGYAHRFMCRLVHGDPPSPAHGAAHSCGNGHLGCVSPRHLSWKTQADNLADCVAHGTQPKNFLGPRGHFTYEQAQAIRARLGTETQLEIANSLGVTESTISDIARGKHYAGPPVHNFWTPDEDAKLKEALSQGLSFSQTAKIVGRPFGATYSRASRLGLKSAQART